MNPTDLPDSRAVPPWMAERPAHLRVAEALNAMAWIGTVVLVLLIEACAGIEHAPHPEAAPQAVPAARLPTSVSVEPTASAEQASATGKATQPSVVPAAPPVQGTAQAATAPSKAVPRPAAKPSAALVLPAKSESHAPAVAKPPAAAPLDLKSLETRLKETQVIGVFTKLALKNQIDDLLDRFRAFYDGKLKTSLADLRRSYDMLVLKVLALLQDADPPLAGAIAASREAIWGVLSNPAKFAAV